MFTDLLSATQDYWHKLDEVEVAYRHNEMTLDEVNAEVQRLMVELGDHRRQALKDFWASLEYFMQQQREVLAGTVVLGVLAYVWLTTGV